MLGGQSGAESNFQGPLDSSSLMICLSLGCKTLPTEKGKLQLPRIALSLLVGFSWLPGRALGCKALASFRSIYYKLESESENRVWVRIQMTFSGGEVGENGFAKPTHLL